jgi:hypothetical protein
MRYNEFNQQLNEFMVLFKSMQGSNLLGVTEDGQEVLIDTAKYQIDLPQNDETDMTTIHDKRQPIERSQMLRQMEPGTPIQINIRKPLSPK